MKAGTIILQCALGAALVAGLQTGALAQSNNSQKESFGKVHRVSQVLGREVYSSDNQRIGRIDNLVVDLETGRILYTVVAVGGGLVGGSDKIGIPPTVYARGGDGRRVNLEVPREALQGAPRFTDSMESGENIASARYAYDVYKHFGQNIWWASSSGQGNSGQFNNVHKVRQLEGMDVKNVMDRKIGDVASVLVDVPAGRIGYVVISPERELDLGNNLFAMPPNALTQHKDGRSLVTDITRERLASAPKFPRNSWPDLNDPSWATRVYSFYGKKPYFDAVSPTGRSQERVYSAPGNERQSEMERIREELRQERERNRELQRDRYESNRDWDDRYENWDDSGF